jgi:hypothetical protein
MESSQVQNFLTSILLSLVTICSPGQHAFSPLFINCLAIVFLFILALLPTVNAGWQENITLLGHVGERPSCSI